jgi:hypothetical protein
MLRVMRTEENISVEEVTEGWIKLHNEEPCNLYYSADVIRVIKVNQTYVLEYCKCSKIQAVSFKVPKNWDMLFFF